MSALRNAEPSALRTGLSQLALSLAAFGALGAGAVGAAMIFGSEDAGGPRVDLALFSEQSGPPPLLKARLSNSLEDEHATSEPTLGVDYDENSEMPVGSGDGEASTISVTEIESHAPVAAVTPLAKAPIAGFYERTPAGDLPKVAADGRTPAEAYA